MSAELLRAELLRAAEELADAVERHLEDGEFGPTQRPMRSEYDEGEDGQQEFKDSLELWEYDCELIKTTLERALRNYRRVEEHAICQRAMAKCSLRNGTAAVVDSEPKCDAIAPAAGHDRRS